MRYKHYITKLCVGILIFFLFPSHCFSQDISGVWTGKLYNDTTKEYIPFELAINENNGKASGFSHTTFISENGKNVGVKEVKIKIKDDGIFVEDEKFLYNNFPEPPPKGVKMFATLNLSTHNSTDVLKGTWKTNATRKYRPLTGTLLLERKKKDPENTAIVKKLDELGMANRLSFLHKPENTVIINIKAKEDSVRKQQTIEALAKAQKAKEDSLLKAREQETLARLQKARADSIRKIEEQEALAKVQKTKEDSFRKAQEHEALAKAQKTREDSIRKIEEERALAKAQKARDDSIRKAEEQEALAKIQKTRVDSIKKIEKQEALAKQQAKEKLLHAEQAKEELAKQRLKQAELVKAQKAKEESERQQKLEAELAKAKKAKEDSLRRQLAQEELLKVRKANPTAAADLSKRKLETIRTVEIGQDSLVLSLYDNGTVDGDTVSVLLNGKVIWPRVGLLVTGINKTIYLTPEMRDSISIVMYAENLGSIPPNTGLLVIREANRIYEIRFSGDLDKNSKIILVRKKKN